MDYFVYADHQYLAIVKCTDCIVRDISRRPQNTGAEGFATAIDNQQQRVAISVNISRQHRSIDNYANTRASLPSMRNHLFRREGLNLHPNTACDPLNLFRLKALKARGRQQRRVALRDWAYCFN